MVSTQFSMTKIGTPVLGRLEQRPNTAPISPAIQDVFFGNTRKAQWPISNPVILESKNRQTLQLRRWWPTKEAQKVGEPDGKKWTQKPVILMLHGLSGRSEWMGPLAEKFMASQNMAVYGLDLPQVGQHPYGKGAFGSTNELVGKIRSSVELLAEKHNAPVYLVGLSLGGLLVASLAGEEPPESLSGIMLISPAFQQNDVVKQNALRSLKTRILKMLTLGKYKGSEAKKLSNGNNYTPEAWAKLTDLQREIYQEKETAKDRIQNFSTKNFLQIGARMIDARNDLAENIKLPVRVYMTNTDHMLNPEATRFAFDQIPSSDKRLIEFDGAAHDLIIDSALEPMAADMNSWLQFLELQRSEEPEQKLSPESTANDKNA